MQNEALGAIDIQNGITKSYSMAKEGCEVHVLSDCVTGYDKRKIDGMPEQHVRGRKAGAEALRDFPGLPLKD